MSATTQTHIGWTMTPNDIIRRSDISPTAKTIWGVIASFTNPDNPDSAWPGLERIANYVGVSSRTVSKYISELKTAGLLEVIRRGLGRTNLTVLAAESALTGDLKGNCLWSGDCRIIHRV